jgi:hypothetical protein
MIISSTPEEKGCLADLRLHQQIAGVCWKDGVNPQV